MTILILSLILAAIVLVVTIWTLARGERGLQEPGESNASGAGGAQGRPEERPQGHQGPPSAGQGLDALRARLSDMPTEGLQSMLDMGATLKPGAEELIRNELERRR